MGLDIKSLQKAAEGALYVSDVRLYVSAEGELVQESDPRAARLLVAAGNSIPAAEAAKYGLIADASPSAVLAEAASAVASEGGAAEASPGPESGQDPLEGLTKKELLALAAERGITVSRKATVGEIRAALASPSPAEDAASGGAEAAGDATDETPAE